MTDTNDSFGQPIDELYEEVENKFRVYSEANLLGSDRASVVAQLMDARDALDQRNVPTARRRLFEVRSVLDTKSGRLHSATPFLLGGYHLLFVAMAVWLGFPESLSKPDTWEIPAAALVFGILGAATRGLWYLYKTHSAGIYRPRFYLGHLIAPAVGLAFGLVGYVLGSAGLLILQGGGPREASQAQGVTITVLLPFLAGMFWEWFFARLERMLDSLSSPTPPTPPVPVPTPPPLPSSSPSAPTVPPPQPPVPLDSATPSTPAALPPSIPTTPLVPLVPSASAETAAPPPARN